MPVRVTVDRTVPGDRKDDVRVYYGDSTNTGPGCIAIMDRCEGRARTRLIPFSGVRDITITHL